MRTDTPQTIFLKNYQPSPYLVDHVSLDFRLDGLKTLVIARLDIRTNSKFDGHKIGEPMPDLTLDGENIELH